MRLGRAVEDGPELAVGLGRPTGDGESVGLVTVGDCTGRAEGIHRVIDAFHEEANGDWHWRGSRVVGYLQVVGVAVVGRSGRD